MAADGAYFVMPTDVGGQIGPVGIWVSAAGWAAAAARALGQAWVLSPAGAFTPEQAAARSARPAAGRAVPGWRRRLPVAPVTLAKDGRRWTEARRFARSMATTKLPSASPAFVWQRHDLFHRAGIDLARRMGVPSVLFVDAPLVWEGRRWGVRRPGWGRLVEQAGERPQFRDADVLACVSEEVADEVARLTGDATRIVVTPCGVDVELFDPAVSGQHVRERHGLEDAFVVGWTGSFRSFHGLDDALDAMVVLARSVPNAALLLVGDGLDRPRIEARADALGVRTAFAGTVAHSEVPAHVAAMDVAVVLAGDPRTFHYSPIKLREYMSSGAAVVASAAGQMARVVRDGVDGVLVEPGDVDQLAAMLTRLHAEPEWRAVLGRNARDAAIRDATWDMQVQRILAAVGTSSPSRGQ